MSAYVKFVCDYCGDTQLEHWGRDLTEALPDSLEHFGWDTSDGYMCRLCSLVNV